VPTIDYDARLEFLNATNTVKWGALGTPLATLVADVVPLYGKLLTLLLRAGRDVYVREFHVPLLVLKQNARPDAQAIVSALETWASGYGLSANEWIMQAAHETARAISLPDSGSPRWCAPTRPLVQPPEPILPAWAHPVESWQAYRENVLAQVEHMLRTYKRLVLDTQPLRARDKVTKKHARWTALRISGLSYGEIALRVQRGDEAATPQAIHQATRKFAMRIGLVHESIN
jgi:hypothetical protein